VYSQWRWALVPRASTSIAVHTYATLGRADQAWHARPYGQLRARHLLRVSCVRAVDGRLQRPCLCPPMIGSKTREPQGLQQGLPLQHNRLRTTPKAIREDCTRVGIDRRGVQSRCGVHWLRAPEATPQYTMRAAATALVWSPHPCPHVGTPIARGTSASPCSPWASAGLPRPCREVRGDSYGNRALLYRVTVNTRQHCTDNVEGERPSNPSIRTTLRRCPVEKLSTNC